MRTNQTFVYGAIAAFIALAFSACVNPADPQDKNTDTVITAAAVTVTAPATGSAPSATAATTDTGYTCGAVSWSPNDNPFKNGTVYTATVTLAASKGYTFTGLTTAAINTQNAAVSNNTGEAVTLTLAFTATDTLSVTWPTGLTALYGKTLATVSLASYTNNGTGAFSWTTPASSVGAVGTRSHNMTFTPTNTSYDTVTKDVDLAVQLLEMVNVAGGTFTMGSSDSQDWDADPPHQVTLTSSFYMGKHEVTQKQWHTVMGTTIQELQTAAAPTNTTDYGRGDNNPVYYVSWYDAIVFCNKLSILEGLTPAYSISGKTDPTEWGAIPTTDDATWNTVSIVSNSTGYRLPTEAQWEYACRAGTTTAWHSGDTDDNLGDYAWYSGNNGNSGEANYGTKEVRNKLANAFGLYDMHGNVWEWCWDWYESYANPAQPGTDPVGASSGSFRVLRGGGWFYPAEFARSAFRYYVDPYYRRFNLGFRVVRPQFNG